MQGLSSQSFTPGTGDGAKVLNTPPCLPTSPSTEATVQFEPPLGRGHITVRPLLSVDVTISDPVASHGLSWLVVEMRRDAEVNGGLGSGDLLDG